MGPGRDLECRRKSIADVMKLTQHGLNNCHVVKRGKGRNISTYHQHTPSMIVSQSMQNISIHRQVYVGAFKHHEHITCGISHPHFDIFIIQYANIP